MRAINKQLKILSEAEISALYEIPDFDYEQRLEYLTLTDKTSTNNVFRLNRYKGSNCKTLRAEIIDVQNTIISGCISHISFISI